MLTTMRDKIDHMTENIPQGVIEAYMLLQSPAVEEEAPKVESTSTFETATGTAVSNVDLPEEVVHSDCKKNLFGVEQDYVKAITPAEFAKIPKYMIGRQTLDNLNHLVELINQILNAKYGVLALGKNGAKKKGQLDLYLEHRKQQTNLVNGDGKIIIFFYLYF